MAAHVNEKRTPFRNVQPPEVFESEVLLEKKSTPRKKSEMDDLVQVSNDDFDPSETENQFSSFAALDQPGGDGELQIQQAESPKRSGIHSVTRASAGRRRGAARPGGMRSSLRHGLRSSVNLRASMSSAAGGELFNREVFDVHSEIDNLLGGLKIELDNWRREFESLQQYWFSTVMCVPNNNGAGNETVHLRTLYEFQCLLERHIEETEFDIQDLEERLKISEIDRCELQKLLEEGSVEVQNLECKNADSHRDYEKKTNSLQTRIMQAESELVQCRKDMEMRDEELDELRKKVVEKSEKIHEVESNAKLQCKALQSSLDSKADECKKVSAELNCKKEEVLILEKEFDAMRTTREALEQEADVKHSKELRKVVSCLEQAKKELKQASVNEMSLSEEVDVLNMDIQTVREEKRELEEHFKTLIHEKQKAFEGEISRTKELLRHRATEERNAIEIAIQKNYDVKIQQIRNEMSEKFSAREKDLIEERNEALEEMQLVHEKAVEAAAAEAASAAAAERARRFEFEEAQRGRTERAIRDALRTADDATSELRKKFAEERELLSNEILEQEQKFKRVLAEREDKVLSMQEEINRLHANKSVLETEINELKSRDKSMKAELNSRLMRVMQEMQMES